MTVRVVTARAPARLDFGGGWTDVPPYCDEAGGTVCNVAVARYATVRLRPVGAAAAPFDAPGRLDADTRLADAALRRAGLTGRVVADLASDFPVGAGLGGSSAAGVALAAAIAAWHRGDDRSPELSDADRDALAEWSRAVEVEDAGIAGGRQDHYAAAYGGALRIDFGAAAIGTPSPNGTLPNGTLPNGGRPNDASPNDALPDGAPARATRLPLTDATQDALERRLFVIYTGESRISGETITAVLDAYRARVPRVVAALGRMRALAVEMSAALARGDVDALGTLVGEHWTHQRALHPAIPTPRIDAIVAAAARAGALGAKALGASGGGCVLVVAAEGREDAVRHAVAPMGEQLAWRVAQRGVQVACLTRA